MSDNPMQCETVRRELADRPAHGDPGADAGVATHLERCHGCRAYAEECRVIAGAGRSLGRANRAGATEAVALRLARQGRERALGLEARPFWRTLPQWGLPLLSASLSTAAVILVLGLSGGGATAPAQKPPTAATEVSAGRRAAGSGDMARLSRLMVVSSSRATDTAIPVDLAVLGDRALSPTLRASAKGATQTEAQHNSRAPRREPGRTP